MLSCAERQNSLFDSVNVVDGHVEVKLLWPLTGRPGRRCKVFGKLERQPQFIDHQHNPVIHLSIEFSAEDAKVKLSQFPRIWRVEDHRAHASE